jgi:hypothetical protein
MTNIEKLQAAYLLKQAGWLDKLKGMVGMGGAPAPVTPAPAAPMAPAAPARPAGPSPAAIEAAIPPEWRIKTKPQAAGQRIPVTAPVNPAIEGMLPREWQMGSGTKPKPDALFMNPEARRLMQEVEGNLKRPALRPVNPYNPPTPYGAVTPRAKAPSAPAKKGK